MFITKGYRDAGIADIVAELGIAHGTFYRYFANKRAILDDVLDYGFERLFLTTFSGHLGPDRLLLIDDDSTFEDFAEIWADAVNQICDLIEAEPGLAQVVLFEATGIDQALTERLFGLHEVSVAAVRAFIDRAMGTAVLRRDINSDSLARILISLMLPPVLWAVQSKGDIDRKSFIEAATAVLRTGVPVFRP